MHDCLIIGGGAVGLSLAYELSGQGQKVRLVDRQQPGQEASWAGAGLLPPCLSRIGHPALDSMVELSNDLHEQWAAQLLEETGIDTEFVRCGAILLATTSTNHDDLTKTAHHWHDRKIQLDAVDAEWITRHEPALDQRAILDAYFAPDEVQLRNPRHLQALKAACLGRGVEIISDVEIVGFDREGGRVTAATSISERITAEQFCICGGTWSTSLLEPFGLPVEVKPMRGQIVLLKTDCQFLNHVIYDGPHYLVPRADGHILVGSTVEDVGFDTQTTDQAVSTMIDFSRHVVPRLADASIKRAWAGLRPATSDGLPYLDRVPDTSNCFVAAGHFRCGLQLSTATAILMRQLMANEAPQIDLSAFSLQREPLATT